MNHNQRSVKIFYHITGKKSPVLAVEFIRGKFRILSLEYDIPLPYMKMQEHVEAWLIHDRPPAPASALLSPPQQEQESVHSAGAKAKRRGVT